MPCENQEILAKVESHLGRPYAAIPSLALLGTAILHWTMQWSLEQTLFMRLVKLVVLPIYIPLVILGPPLVIALSAWYFARRTESVFWAVFYVAVFFWGFSYLLPPIVENWDSFMKFVDDFGAV